MTTPIAIQVLLITLSASAALISGLVLANLRAVSKKQSEHEARISAIEKEAKEDVKEAAYRKDKCNQDFVDKVDYIREVTKLEATMESLLKLTSEIKGSMTGIEQMPKICGNIASQIVKQMRNSGNG
ncbi:MAG: hypothetical protein KAT00_06100 [Planctomycetes bacterium]|nr:hypothetical protein [Planctomycetota bacterium]